MDDALRLAHEMTESMWLRLENALEDLTEEEIDWRPLPEANSINVIVRHLRIEAQWHLDSLERGEPMPTVAVQAPQSAIDAVPLIFRENFRCLQDLYLRFAQTLCTITLSTLEERSASAYGEASKPSGRRYLLGYHQSTHLATHIGQIRTIRNLYSKTRGESARFVPDNPTYLK